MPFKRNNGFLSPSSASLLFSILSAAALQAGDKINFSEPVRKNEMPKAGPKFEEFSKSYDFLDKASDGAAGTFNVPPAPSSMGPSPANMKKIEEYLDKKKNWIFENAREANNSSSKDNDRKREESSSAKFEGRNQSVMESYFSERERPGKSEQPDDHRRSSSPFDPGTSFFRAENDPFNAPRNDDSGPNMEFNLNGYLRNDRFTGNDDRGINSPMDIRSSFNAMGRDNIKSEKRLERERAEEMRQAEFQKLLQPRSLTPSVAGTVDTLNRQYDATRQEANPIAPRGYTSPLMGGGSSSSSSLPSSANISRSPIGGPSFADSMSIQNPMVNPLRSPTIAPSAAAPSFTPAPFVLDIQRRKF